MGIGLQGIQDPGNGMYVTQSARVRMDRRDVVDVCAIALAEQRNEFMAPRAPPRHFRIPAHLPILCCRRGKTKGRSPGGLRPFTGTAHCGAPGSSFVDVVELFELALEALLGEDVFHPAPG